MSSSFFTLKNGRAINNKTKLIKTKIIEFNENKETAYYYGDGTDETYWDYYLNNNWYNSLSDKTKNLTEYNLSRQAT